MLEDDPLTGLFVDLVSLPAGLGEIFRGCLPFLGIVILSMAIVYVLPGIVTWLPDMLYGR